MSNYRRAYINGGTWFFTVNILQRHQNNLLISNIELLRQTVKKVRANHPFHIDAWVVLPDHIHCILTLPSNDADFSNRWRLIKSGFSRPMPNTEYRSDARIRNGERGIWQRHYWEHYLRDDSDYQKHVDYIHVNPLKHGYIEHVIDWFYPTFHQHVAKGIYPANWCGDINIVVGGGD